jgi:exopolyphosphatase/guanosine-5'-triphosphate,3'-diphosphate pyrophosphatase
MADSGAAGGRFARPIGVVDIGSNSIRLVVFEGARRAPLPIFNEKVLCGLGRGLETTGQLNPEGAALALDNLARFARLAAAMGVRRSDLRMVATRRCATPTTARSSCARPSAARGCRSASCRAPTRRGCRRWG